MDVLYNKVSASKTIFRARRKEESHVILCCCFRPMIVINSHRIIREAFIRRAEVFSNRPVMHELEKMCLYDGKVH